MEIHTPIMLKEVVKFLITSFDGFYIDATFGGGGHTNALLQNTSKHALVLAIDQDSEAIKQGEIKFAKQPKLILRHGKFSAMDLFLEDIRRKKQHANKEISGILMDLGISSCQMDNAARGFSFSVDGPLDMRMDRSQGMPFSVWLETAKAQDLEEILKNFGNEPRARLIARAIIDYRSKKSITRTKQLASIIVKALPRSPNNKIHPATRSFQAARIFVNQEIKELEDGLNKAVRILRPGGRLAVIGFHSLEHRLVKALGKKLKPIHKIMPTRAEVLANNRSRSSVLRVLEKAA